MGGGSWLAHATLLSGLWIDNQQRYRTLVSSDRLTLTSAFQRAGWRTVGVEPAITGAWPEGEFYGYDRVYDSRNLGYRGPRFSYATDARPVHPRRLPARRARGAGPRRR